MGDHDALARQVLDRARAASVMVVTAESCTGGLVSAALTDIPGSSDVVDRGFVTYTNDAKREMLGVADATLEAFGAVSKETAQEMAEGALARSQAQIAVSITGIAGPGGGSADKPVGLVWFAVARTGGQTRLVQHLFEHGGRSGVRQASVETALILVLDALS